MKNSNLLNRLLSYSHEKQSPQRFARYAAMLIMLLTLGVGQMWAGSATATTVYYAVPAGTVGCYTVKLNVNFKGDGSDWHTYTMTKTGNTYSGKIVYSASYTDAYGGVGCMQFQLYDGGTYKSQQQPYGSWTDVSKYNGKVYIHDTGWNTASWDSSYKVYFARTSNWDYGTPYVYAWNGSCDYNAGWPGQQMSELTGKTYNGKKIYYKEVGKRYTDVKFSNNGSNQTANMTLYSTNANKMYYYNGSSDMWVTLQYDVTLDQQEGSSGTSSIIAVCGSAMPGSKTAPSKTGYDFNGYYTGTSGGGTKYYNANMTSANTWPSDATGPTTLYAYWTAKTTTVTLNKNTPDGETVSGATSVTATYNSALPSFTAQTCTGGYALKGYYDATSDGNLIITSAGVFNANSGIWNRTDGSTLTLYAQWSLDRTLTYDGNTNTSGNVPAAATNYANGTEVTVLGNTAASPLVKTGYSFTGWNTDAGGEGASYAASSTITMNANYTLYAQWSENMSTVSVGASPAGAGTFSSNSVSAGVDTKPSVTATAQPGYKFTSWGITGGADMSGSTDNPVTITGKGAGAAATLTATFSRLYAYIQGRFKVKDAARSTTTTTYATGGQWEDSSTNIQMEYDDTNHRFELHTHMTPSELTANHGTGCQDCKPYFFIKTSTSNSSLAGVTTYKCTSSGATLVSTGSANGAAVSSSSANSLRFNSTTTTSYAVVYFDESKIWYELEQRLQYDANGGSGTAPTGDNGHNSYHAKGTNATAASNPFTARTNYTFAGWNTDQYITGTNYAAGASVTMNANTTLYAKWTRTVTLEQEGATREGSTSVIGTWNCSTLPTINNPEKTGYDFGGWYTETAGNGNIIINTSGQLQASKTNWTDASGRFQRTPSSDASESKPLYAKWTQTVTLNANTSYHGSGDNTTATIVYKATAKTSITHCTPATGYQLEGYYTANTGGTKILNADGSFAGTDVAVSTDDYIVGGAWVHAGNTTLYAHYTAKSYDVTLKPNGATTGSDQVVRATYDATMPTQTKTSAALVAPTKTGYTLQGFYQNSNGTGTKYYNANMTSANNWDQDGSVNIWAKWQANPYTITLTQSGETGYGSSGTESVEATFDAALPTIVSLPTAANGYAFMGYYTDHNGEGTQYYNASGTKLVASYTTADDLELFAYFKKAAVTEISFSPAAAVAPTTEITATPTIDPSPVGPVIVCWELQYNNGTPLPSQPTFTPGEGNAVSFDAPEASATYRLQATLRTGSACDGGTELSVYSTTFKVAGEHTVTVRYQDSDGRTLASSIEVTGKPFEWSEESITAPTITGYKFDHWSAGDGVTIKDGSGEDKTSSTSSSIKIKAIYDGTLTAVYAKKRLIFFNNTLGWSSVYVYFYKNDSYWESTGDKRGSGANGKFPFTDYPFSENYWGEMTQIEGTNIYYFDAENKGVNASYDDVVFTKDRQYGYDYFNNTKAVRRGDYNSTQLPMFVPLADQTPATHNNTGYYNSGYWMNYPENTGYSLLIYNQTTKSGAVKLYEFPFEFTEDFTMPMELTVDLEAGQTYGFEIKRADGTYYSNTGTMTANTTNWAMTKDQSSYCGLKTTAAGNYTFRLYYSSSSYRMDVTYPVAVNDYRIVYTDLATWSKDAHTASWYHPSRVITKNNSATETKKDTISFFWTHGSSPAIKYQKCTGTGTGTVSWNAGTAINVSAWSSVLTKVGVYNFIFAQPAGGASIALVKVEPYTGKYYIRTDCAGSTKWTNYQAVDHEMTYSDYTETNHGYSHYYPHWVDVNKNVKFVIANDYSPCISDTLTEDYGTTIADITTEGNANAGKLNGAGANIRFMWKQSANKISRAYIGGSTNISDRFLVLEGDAKMFDENGNALTDAGGGKISGLNNYEMNLVDDQNFVYERTIKVQTGAKAKLTAKYNNNVQYFKGSPGTTSADSVVLLGGSASVTKHTMRIVYDFKTNRLVTAYVPSDTIKNALAINADLMIVREHQEGGQQLVFKGEGALSEVKTVYGVMRFNRWTLNNKEKTGEHDPVDDPKSAYERGLYWISFPFNVNLSDVFGFGTYGTHWIIMEYDGAARATEGYWADSNGFWKYVTNRTGKVLEAGKGYVLALDLDLMKSNNTSFWANNIEQVELFFPSAKEVENIEATNVTTTVDPHECTIDRTNNNGPDINKNRTCADSHWNMIGIPSYANYGETLKAGAEGEVITWNSSPYTDDLPFLYEWSTVDNTYAVQSGTKYPFKAMHAYMVQYHGNLYWSLASATPVDLAPRRYEEALSPVEYRLELQQNEKKIDQTFVKLSNDENVSANFAFDEDLCKEYNANKANIYTFIENYIPAAGNTLPMSEQTMVVPVGVKIVADGDYTFAIPDGTEGIGVTLIDNETGIRTPLSALDYTINMSAGTYDNRFVLEISPIQQMPTGVESLNGENGTNSVRKVLIDGLLYIVKDGKMFDAQGRQVK